MQIKPGIRGWQVGRRVARKDGEELGSLSKWVSLAPSKLNGTVAAPAITA
jgi:hypothetical protein